MTTEMTIDEPEVSATPSTDEVTVTADPPSASTPSRLSSIDVGGMFKAALLPLLGLVVFVGAWAAVAPMINTSLGTLPGPSEVASAGGDLWDEFQANRTAASEFYAAQNARNEALIAEGRAAEVQDFAFAGSTTFPSQVWTSLKTVALGFAIASLIAIPIGLLSGLSPAVHSAINPLVQIMKPISPLAWLPIVTMVVAATITSPDPLLPKSFVISAVVVALCSLWPTLINTHVGTASVDGDLQNVAKVLRLGWFAKLRKLVLPSALPYIFTGMRLSLGVGWMVLIAAEMLAQNPGLGKFVWDEFQNGSSNSLSRIMFAVIVIGIIGYFLDRVMSTIENLVSKSHAA